MKLKKAFDLFKPIKAEFERWVEDYGAARVEIYKSEKEKRYHAEHPDYPDSIFTIFIPTDEKVGKSKSLMQVSFKPLSMVAGHSNN